MVYQVFDRVTRNAYLDLIARGYRPTSAAKLCYVSPRTVRKTRERDPFFAKAEQEAMASVVDSLEEKALELALAGDIQALKLMLGAFKPEMYRPVPANMLGIQMNQSGGTLPANNSYENKSVEELRAEALAILTEAANENASFKHLPAPFIDTTATEEAHAHGESG